MIPPLATISRNNSYNRINPSNNIDRQMPPLARVRQIPYPFKKDKPEPPIDILDDSQSFQSDSVYIQMAELPEQQQQSKNSNKVDVKVYEDSRSERVVMKQTLSEDEEELHRFDVQSERNQFMDLNEQEWTLPFFAKNHQHTNRSSEEKPLFYSEAPQPVTHSPPKAVIPKPLVVTLGPADDKFSKLSLGLYEHLVKQQQLKGTNAGSESAEMTLKGVLTRPKKMQLFLASLQQQKQIISRQAYTDSLIELGNRDDIHTSMRDHQMPNLHLNLFRIGKQTKKNLDLFSCLLVKLSSKIAHVHVKHQPLHQQHKNISTSRSGLASNKSKPLKASSAINGQSPEQSPEQADTMRQTVSKITHISFEQPQQNNRDGTSKRIKQLKQKLDNKERQFQQVKMHYDTIVNNFIKSIQNIKSKLSNKQKGDLFEHILGAAKVTAEDRDVRISNTMTFMGKPELTSVYEQSEPLQGQIRSPSEVNSVRDKRATLQSVPNLNPMMSEQLDE